jgi:hypothetical protein
MNTGPVNHPFYPDGYFFDAQIKKTCDASAYMQGFTERQIGYHEQRNDYQCVG